LFSNCFETNISIPYQSSPIFPDKKNFAASCIFRADVLLYDYGLIARTESRMKTVHPQIRNTVSGTVAGRTKRRNLLFFVCGFLLLTMAALAALAADGCFGVGTAVRDTILQLADTNHDNALRNTAHQTFAAANNSVRLSSSQVQRLLLRGVHGQYRSHISRAPFALLLIWLAVLLSSTLYAHAFRHRALSALFHFQTLLKTILPVRAGPFFCRTSATALSF